MLLLLLLLFNESVKSFEELDGVVRFVDWFDDVFEVNEDRIDIVELVSDDEVVGWDVDVLGLWSLRL